MMLMNRFLPRLQTLTLETLYINGFILGKLLKLFEYNGCQLALTYTKRIRCPDFSCIWMNAVLMRLCDFQDAS